MNVKHTVRKMDSSRVPEEAKLPIILPKVFLQLCSDRKFKFVFVMYDLSSGSTGQLSG